MQALRWRNVDISGSDERPIADNDAVPRVLIRASTFFGFLTAADASVGDAADAAFGVADRFSTGPDSLRRIRSAVRLLPCLIAY